MRGRNCKMFRTQRLWLATDIFVLLFERLLRYVTNTKVYFLAMQQKYFTNLKIYVLLTFGWRDAALQHDIRLIAPEIKPLCSNLSEKACEKRSGPKATYFR